VLRLQTGVPSIRGLAAAEEARLPGGILTKRIGKEEAKKTKKLRTLSLAVSSMCLQYALGPDGKVRLPGSFDEADRARIKDQIIQVLRPFLRQGGTSPLPVLKPYPSNLRRSFFFAFLGKIAAKPNYKSKNQ
jgi:hypothetical protein